MVPDQRVQSQASIFTTGFCTAIVFLGPLGFGAAKLNLGILAPTCKEAVGRNPVPIAQGSPTCTKFIVLTTQRSRSTWFSEALGNQPEVFCPTASESLITFSKRSYKEQISPEEWAHAADHAFDAVCKEAQKHGKKIAGFKLMYDQVKGPGQVINGTHLPDGWFQEYLHTRKVRIVHLVREAVILNLASSFQTAANAKQLNLNGSNTHHTADPKSVAARGHTEKFPFTDQHLPLLHAKEREHVHWLHFLRRTGLPYHYLSYEDLMSHRRDILVHMALQFLGVRNLVSYPKLHGGFLRIHKFDCEGRIANFKKVKRLLHGTMSARACRILALKDFE